MCARYACSLGLSSIMDDSWHSAERRRLDRQHERTQWTPETEGHGTHVRRLAHLRCRRTLRMERFSQSIQPSSAAEKSVNPQVLVIGDEGTSAWLAPKPHRGQRYAACVHGSVVSMPVTKCGGWIITQVYWRSGDSTLHSFDQRILGNSNGVSARLWMNMKVQ